MPTKFYEDSFGIDQLRHNWNKLNFNILNIPGSLTLGPNQTTLAKTGPPLQNLVCITTLYSTTNRPPPKLSYKISQHFYPRQEFAVGYCYSTLL